MRLNIIILNYSIICLFRIALGPDEKFGLDRVRITESSVQAKILKGDAY